MFNPELIKLLRETADKSLELYDPEGQEPMDGSDTAKLAALFRFLLDEVHGNLSKRELDNGYKKFKLL